jgi:hypothetical protein
MFEKPYVISGVGILVGYIHAAIRREPRFEDAEYLRFFRRYEFESLLFGRVRTMRKFNQQVRANFNRRPSTPSALD